MTIESCRPHNDSTGTRAEEVVQEVLGKNGYARESFRVAREVMEKPPSWVKEKLAVLVSAQFRYVNYLYITRVS